MRIALISLHSCISTIMLGLQPAERYKERDRWEERSPKDSAESLELNGEAKETISSAYLPRQLEMRGSRYSLPVSFMRFLLPFLRSF